METWFKILGLGLNLMSDVWHFGSFVRVSGCNGIRWARAVGMWEVCRRQGNIFALTVVYIWPRGG